MIIVDSREPRSVALEVALGSPKGEEVKIEELKAGDILLERNGREVLIERKTPADFLASLSDGRLFHQAMSMKKQCSRSLILITGHLYPSGKGVRAGAVETGWNLWSVRMAILRLQLAGVAVLEIGNRDLPEMIKHLFRFLEREPKGVPPSVPDPLVPISSEVWFLAQLPGIGPERARNLLSSFLTPWNAITAIESGDAVKAKGLGKKTVERARKFLKGDD